MTGERNERGGAAPEEQALRDDFAALREQAEASGVPDFGEMIARARAEAERSPTLVVEPGGVRRTWLGRTAWVSMAAAAAVAGLMMVRSGPDAADAEFERLVASYSADAALGAWSSPTDGLLRTPGIDLGALPSVRSVPLPSRDQDDGGRDS